MEILNIENKKKLNDFLRNKKHTCLLQSWQWGEYQKDLGNNIFRTAVNDKGNIRAVATIIKNKTIFGDYYYAPLGPIFFEDKEADAKEKEIFLKGMMEMAKKEKIIFMRFEPAQEVQCFRAKIKKTIDVQPSKSIIIELKKTEEELLKSMHSKTRYNIRLAEKKGVKIREVKDRLGEFDKFWQLMEKTGQRDAFRLHNKEHYQKMFKINRKYIKLFFGEYEGEVICAGIFSFFGDTVVYLHGASSNQYRNVMAPYLMQWYTIRLAKLWGFSFYDFFGIDEKKWPGVTRFKKGFGGYEKNHPGTFDLIFNKPLYSVYKILRKIRRMF